MKNPFKKLVDHFKSNGLLDSGKNRETPCGWEQFLNLLEIERSRSHRNNSEFSLIVIKIDQREIREAVVSQFIRTIAKRIRRIDKIGWHEKGQIGILLPCTNRHGAKKIADELAKGTQARALTIEFSMYSYPAEN